MVASTKVVRNKSKKEILARMLPQLLEKRMVMRQKARQKKYGNFESLTPRQIQVIKLVLDGYGYTEIAEALYISVYTARNHVHRIYKILGVRGKRGLISSLSSEEIDFIQKRFEVGPGGDIPDRTSIASKSNFTVIRFPDGGWLPPELIYLLPNISGSELKVLAAVLYNYLQIGGGEPTSLKDIEHLTGLSRPTVIAALDRLLAGHVLERLAEGRSFIYMPIVKFFNHPETQPVKNFYQSEAQLVKKFNHSGRPVKKFNQSSPQLVKNFYQFEPQLVKNFNQLELESEESERELINDLSIKDSLSDSLNSESGKKILLLQKLRACGVYLKTAQALVNELDEAEKESFFGGGMPASVYNYLGLYIAKI